MRNQHNITTDWGAVGNHLIRSMHLTRQRSVYTDAAWTGWVHVESASTIVRRTEMTIMHENEMSPLGKGATSFLVAMLAIGAVVNIVRGEVAHPYAFVIVLFGFALFMLAKLSVVGWKKWVSFGTLLMSPAMADLYRVGYWFMVVGILLTFVP